jgi:hypothetical protein
VNKVKCELVLEFKCNMTWIGVKLNLELSSSSVGNRYDERRGGRCHAGRLAERLEGRDQERPGGREEKNQTHTHTARLSD